MVLSPFFINQGGFFLACVVHKSSRQIIRAFSMKRRRAADAATGSSAVAPSVASNAAPSVEDIPAPPVSLVGAVIRPTADGSWVALNRVATGKGDAPVGSHDDTLLWICSPKLLSLSALLEAAGGGGGACAASLVARGTLPPLQAALLRFATPAAASRALRAAAPAPAPSVAASIGLRGLLAAQGSHKQDPRALQRALDGFMAEFEAAEGTAAASASAVSAAMDADGFTVVRRRGAGGVGAGVGSGAPADESANARRKRKRGSLIVPDFYKFQKNGDTAARLATLRAQFAEDRQRIASIRERGGGGTLRPGAFKPI